jgi:hypothetical protein
MSQAPVCVNCNQEMVCSKNGKVIHDPKVGDWAETYWVGDEYECPICHNTIVVGFALRSFLLAELRQIMPNFDPTTAVPFVHSVKHRNLLEQYKEKLTKSPRSS